MSVYYVIMICLHVVAYIMLDLDLRLLLYMGVIHVYICVYGCLMTYGHSDIMHLVMCSLRTHSIYLLYLYMHIFNVNLLMMTVQAYIDRDVNVTGNIWLTENGISYLTQSFHSCCHYKTISSHIDVYSHCPLTHQYDARHGHAERLARPLVPWNRYWLTQCVKCVHNLAY